MKKLLYIYSIVLLSFGLGSCSKDFLDTNPTDQVTDVTAASSIEAINANLSGVIRVMKSESPSNKADDYGIVGIGLGQELMGEDVVCESFNWYTDDYDYSNAINDNYRRPKSIWRIYYKIIYNCNQIIKNVTDINADVAIKNRIKAEALSLRAFSFFRLIRLYQGNYSIHKDDLGIPIVLDGSTIGKPRSKVSEVYAQINKDLDAALILFATAEARADISHVNINVCHGIKARVALEMENWAAAKIHADLAVAGFNLNTVEEFAAGFDDAGNQEWMWGLLNNSEQSSIYGSFASHMDISVAGYAGLGYNRKYVYSGLYAQMAPTDERKALIIDRTISLLAKAKKELADATTAKDKADAQSDIDAYTASLGSRLANYKFNAAKGGRGMAAEQVLMRPEEMILISAEADARLGNDGSATTTLDKLRAVRYKGYTAGSIDLTGTILTDILLERRIELWGEGFRLYDVKRQNIDVDRAKEAVDAGVKTNHSLVLNSVVGALVVKADSDYLTFLIPIGEINNNPAISINEQNHH